MTADDFPVGARVVFTGTHAGSLHDIPPGVTGVVVGHARIETRRHVTVTIDVPHPDDALKSPAVQRIYRVKPENLAVLP